MSIKSDEIPNLYKPDYKGDRYADNLCKKLIEISNDTLAHKVVFGSKQFMQECRERQHSDEYNAILRKIRYNQVVRHHELFFNQKLNKYKSDYLNKLFDLLNKNEKPYTKKRKMLTLKNEEINPIKKNRIPLKLPNRFSIKNRLALLKHNILNEDTHQEEIKEINNNIKEIKHNSLLSYDKKERIIDIKDDEYAMNDSKLYYSTTKIFGRLAKASHFIPSKEDAEFLNVKNRIMRELEPMKIAEVYTPNSRNRQISIAKIKRSTSYEVIPLETYNQNIYIGSKAANSVAISSRNNWRSKSKRNLLSSTVTSNSMKNIFSPSRTTICFNKVE